MWMFLAVVAAGALSGAVGLAVAFFAANAWPVGFEAYGFLFGAVFCYSLIAMVVFELTLCWGRTERALGVAALLLIALPIVLLLSIAISDFGVARFESICSASLLLVVAVQWLVLRTALQRVHTTA